MISHLIPGAMDLRRHFLLACFCPVLIVFSSIPEVKAQSVEESTAWLNTKIEGLGYYTYFSKTRSVEITVNSIELDAYGTLRLKGVESKTGGKEKPWEQTVKQFGAIPEDHIFISRFDDAA